MIVPFRIERIEEAEDDALARTIRTELSRRQECPVALQRYLMGWSLWIEAARIHPEGIVGEARSTPPLDPVTGVHRISHDEGTVRVERGITGNHIRVAAAIGAVTDTGHFSIASFLRAGLGRFARAPRMTQARTGRQIRRTSGWTCTDCRDVIAGTCSRVATVFASS